MDINKERYSLEKWSDSPKQKSHRAMAILVKLESKQIQINRSVWTKIVEDVLNAKNPSGTVASLATNTGNAYGRVTCFDDKNNVCLTHLDFTKSLNWSLSNNDWDKVLEVLDKAGNPDHANQFNIHKTSPKSANHKPPVSDHKSLEFLWLVNPLDCQATKVLKSIFEDVFMKFDTELKREEFDMEVYRRLKNLTQDISLPDEYKISDKTKHTVDIKAKISGFDLIIEIEKAEIKRVPHDLLKIAAVQKQIQNAVGIIISPNIYKTKNNAFSRTFKQEAIAVMDLMQDSLGWNSSSVAMVIYDVK